MIDEKKLIEKLNRLESIVADYRSDVRQGYLNLICEIKDFVNEQPRVNQWIPCSERLPKEHGWYLVQYSKELLGGLIIEVVGYDERGFLGSISDVIAWIPLPEPYQEEKDETL